MPSVFWKSLPVPAGTRARAGPGRRPALGIDVGLNDFVQRSVPADHADRVHALVSTPRGKARRVTRPARLVERGARPLRFEGADHEGAEAPSCAASGSRVHDERNVHVAPRIARGRPVGPAFSRLPETLTRQSSRNTSQTGRPAPRPRGRASRGLTEKNLALRLDVRLAH